MSTMGSGGNGDGSAPKGGPRGAISDTLAKPLAKRFYKEVTIGDGAFFQVLLDGRVIKTPAKRALVLPTRALAELVAGEWAAQKEVIDPSQMPLTRFANTAIDAVSVSKDEVAGDLVAYAGRDLVCYRAESQPDLLRRQEEAWDPVIAWARESLGAHLTVVKGVMPVDQPQPALNKFATALEPLEAFKLTGLHVLTTLTGSALLALAHARGFLSADEAWAAAHVDEDYQKELWGDDYEAGEKRKQRRAEFDAASRMLAALG